MRRLLTQLISVASLTATPFVPCWSQESTPADERAEVARQIKRAIEDLQAAREARRIANSAHQAEVDALERQIEVLQGQVSPLEADVAAQDAEIADLKLKEEAAQKKSDTARGWIRITADHLKPIAANVLARVRGGVDESRTRRTVEFTSAQELLAGETPQARAEGVREFLRLLGEEWQPARSVTLQNQTVLTENDTKMDYAWVVGFGLVARAFVSEDESTVGLSVPRGNWKLDLDDETKQRVKTLLGVVREKLPPSITAVPVFVPDGNTP